MFQRKWIWLIAMAVALMASVSLSPAVSAQAPDGLDFESLLAHPDQSRRHPGRHRGLIGEVMAVGEDQLTIVTRNGREVIVNVSEDTKIALVESGEQGTLADIEPGDMVKVLGRRNEEGTVDARAIVVLPDGDRIAGRVTEVDGTEIHVENPHGTFIILTDENTVFRLGRRGEGSLDDVTPGRKLVAFGEKLDDTTLAANLVILGPGGNHQPPAQP